MDDYPAGPASPGARRPPLSVVIPVRNGGSDFERCLRALHNSQFQDFELIVVDDGSLDGSGGVAEAVGARVIRHERPRGPAAARNTGANVASGSIVFFLDADVAAHPHTLGSAIQRLHADPGLAAVFGSYDDQPAAPGLVSQFRNLLHHFTHQSGEFHDNTRLVHTFWTGCGAIRRDAFLGIGGFDPLLYRRPAIEDIELGYRLRRAGQRIALARDLLVTHLKRWSLAEMIRTDIFRRGVPWTLLILRSGEEETDLNVSPTQRACTAATVLAATGPFLAIAFGSLAWNFVTALGLAIVLGLNHTFYRFLARRLGMLRAAACLPLHAIYFLCCAVSVAIALALWCTSSRAREGVSWPVGSRVDRVSVTSRPRRTRPKRSVPR